MGSESGALDASLGRVGILSFPKLLSKYPPDAASTPQSGAQPVDGYQIFYRPVFVSIEFILTITNYGTSSLCFCYYF